MKWIELEDEVVNLEQAENLLIIYHDFLDDECPAQCELEQKDYNEVAIKAVQYANRTEIYKSVLAFALRMIAEIRGKLSAAVDEMIAEAKEAKAAEAKAIKQ